MSHTQEPWAWREKYDTAYITVEPRGDVCVFPGSDPEAFANARRVVACVNALAGISAEELEEFVRDGGALHFEMGGGHSQRIAELEAALERLLGRIDAAHIDAWKDHDVDWFAIEAARAALKRETPV